MCVCASDKNVRTLLYTRKLNETHGRQQFYFMINDNKQEQKLLWSATKQFGHMQFSQIYLVVAILYKNI